MRIAKVRNQARMKYGKIVYAVTAAYCWFVC